MVGMLGVEVVFLGSFWQLISSKVRTQRRRDAEKRVVIDLLDFKNLVNLLVWF